MLDRHRQSRQLWPSPGRLFDVTPICAMNVTPHLARYAGVWSTAWQAQTGLPPGPRMPRPIQTAIWSRQAQWLLAQSRRRLRPDVHARDRLRRDLGRSSPTRSWSSRSSPATRRSSTPARATRSCGPLLGDNSSAGPRRRAAHEPAQAAAAALPRQADGRLRARRCARSPRAEIESWPTGDALPAAPADAGDDARDHPRDRLRRARGRAPATTCARRCATSSTCSPTRGCCVPMLAIGPERLRALPALPPPRRRGSPS